MPVAGPVRWWFAIAALLAGAPAALAHGGMDRAPSGLPGAFYIGQATTTGFDTRYRADGMARALRKVLVRVSGDPALAHDPRVAALAPDVRALIQVYSYRDEMAGIPRHDEQGTYDRPYMMTVAFDPGKIDALLARLGEKPWPVPRPVIIPVVLVRGRDAPNTQVFLVTAEEKRAANARLSLARFALRYGVTVHVPTAAEMRAWHVTTAGFPAVDSADGAVIADGTATFRVATVGWVGVWRLRLGNDIRVWSVAGVELDQALDSLIAGAVAAASGHPPP